MKILLSLLMILTLSGAVFAQCPDLIELDCGGGSAWFGLRHDGANVAQGQTVTLECDAAILGAEFKFIVTGNPNGGVPSMVAGDEIMMTVVDVDGNEIMTASAPVPADVYSDWLSFEFPEDMTVPAGVYTFAAYTTVQAQCGIVFCPSEDLYTEGERVVSLNGLEGPWGSFPDGHDIPFRVHLNSDSVPTDAVSLTNIKGLFQ